MPNTAIHQNVTILQDPSIISGLINQIDINEGYLWPRLISVEPTTGKKWKSRQRTVRALMAKLLDLSEKLPFLMKGQLDDREGEFIKLGGALPIEPEELMGLDHDGEIPAELARIAQALRTGIDGAIEYITMRGFAGQSILLEGGADTALESPGDETTVGTAWSNIAATGIDDLLTMKDTCKGLNQEQNPELIVMSSTAWENLRKQTTTQTMVFGTSGSGTTVGFPALRDLFASNELPPVIVYDGLVELPNGVSFTETRVLPADIVLMFPSTRKFPSGYGRMFTTRTTDQIVNANKGLVDPSLGGMSFIYGWVEVQTNPGRYEVNGLVGSGFDLEATSKICTLDVTP